MPHVLVLSLVFPPDAVSTAQIMGDLVQDLRARGHTVSVVTTTPHYNRDAGAEARQPLRPWWGPLVQRSDFHGDAGLPHGDAAQDARRSRGAWRRGALFHALSLRRRRRRAAQGRRHRHALAAADASGLVAWLLGALAPGAVRLQRVRSSIRTSPSTSAPFATGRSSGSSTRSSASSTAGRRVITLIADRMRDRLLREGRAEPTRSWCIPNFVDVDASLRASRPQRVHARARARWPVRRQLRRQSRPGAGSRDACSTPRRLLADDARARRASC